MSVLAAHLATLRATEESFMGTWMLVLYATGKDTSGRPGKPYTMEVYRAQIQPQSEAPQAGEYRDNAGHVIQRWKGFIPHDSFVKGAEMAANGLGSSADVWRQAWAGGTAYVANDTVGYAKKCWIAVAPSTGVTPGTDGSKWKEVRRLRGDWDAVTAFLAGDVAFVSNDLYLANADNTNVAPATNPTTWTKLTRFKPESDDYEASDRSCLIMQMTLVSK